MPEQQLTDEVVAALLPAAARFPLPNILGLGPPPYPLIPNIAIFAGFGPDPGPVWSFGSEFLGLAGVQAVRPLSLCLWPRKKAVFRFKLASSKTSPVQRWETAPTPRRRRLQTTGGAILSGSAFVTCDCLKVVSWNRLIVTKASCLLRFLRPLGWQASLRNFLATSDGRTILPLDTSTQPGQTIFSGRRICKMHQPGAKSILRFRFFLERVEALLLRTFPASLRKEGLLHQKSYLASDQIASALSRIAGACSNVRVLKPLLMMQRMQDEDPATLRTFGVTFTKGVTVITAMPLQGHWLTFAWDIRFLRFEARDSCPVGRLDLEVSTAHRIWGKVLRYWGSSFTFCQGPVRPPAPGLPLCTCRFARATPPSHDGALALVATFAAAF